MERSVNNLIWQVCEEETILKESLGILIGKQKGYKGPQFEILTIFGKSWNGHTSKTLFFKVFFNSNISRISYVWKRLGQ